MKPNQIAALNRARALVGTKTRFGVEFIGVLLSAFTQKAEGIECLCPCGTVWTVTISYAYHHPVRSCMACLRKRQSRYMHYLEREQPTNT